MKALILFAHGARDTQWLLPLERIRSCVEEANPQARVCLAFLSFQQPVLGECIARLAADGYDEIIIMPLLVSRGGHVSRDLPALLDEARISYPNIRFELAQALGEVDEIVAAMAGYAKRLLDR